MKYILKKIVTCAVSGLMAGGCLVGFISLMNVGLNQLNEIDKEQEAEKQAKIAVSEKKQEET